MKAFQYPLPALLFYLWLMSPTRAVTIDTVPVANAGNAGDLQPQGAFGAVAYNYRISKYEVTLGQYTEFLNAVAATDTYALYDPAMATELSIAGIARSGSLGSYAYNVIGSPNKPAGYISWGAAARFANWLHNGQPTGAQDATTTEDGTYTLNGATTTVALAAVTRNAGARWFIPSENEWYKAAYHRNDGVTGNYWDYPTSTNDRPYSDQPPGNDAPAPSNTANIFEFDGIVNGYDDGYAVTGSSAFNNTQNYLTDIGAYTLSASPYGTFDQGGNLAEWTEHLETEQSRIIRGGSFAINPDGSTHLRASYRSDLTMVGIDNTVGFRVATVPEPSSLGLSIVSFAGMIARYGRRRRGLIHSGILNDGCNSAC